MQWLRGFELELTENEALALTFVKRNKKITNGEYQRLNNINRDKAFLEIKRLIKKGAIKSNGIGSGTYYVLNHEVNVAPPKINTQDEAEDRLQEILIFCKSSKSKKEIAEYLGLKNLNHFEKMYLKPLLDEKKLIMTIPEKPTSRNQKYITSTIM
ncbi:MAG: hypothetical protein H7Y18_08480 [Clostridiaceae bacterium]|nr:hypothetical protein [Clostridiaceae bacterium]